MKKVFSVLLLVCMCLSFVACGGDGSDNTDSATAGSQSEISSSDVSGSSDVTESSDTTETSSDITETSSDITETSSDITETSSDASVEVSTDTDTDTSSDTEEEKKDPVPNLVLAGDQYNQKVIVYNLDNLNPGDDLELAEEWTYNVGISHVAGLKYREDTVFGDVILIAAGATNGKAQMVSYPEGKLLWSTDKAGNNPHCIEILPSGNIVVASSTGGTLRLFKTSALLNGDTATAATYVDMGLYGAHGVLWDPQYNVLWGLGDDYLYGFNVTGEGVDEKLTPNAKNITKLPADGGHVLSPDLTDSAFLYISVNTGVYRFSKDKKVFIPAKEISRANVKGIAYNANGDFVLAIPNGGAGTKWQNMGYGGWCTDTLTFCYLDGDSFKEQTYKSAYGSAFYKIYVFYGQYQ